MHTHPTGYANDLKNKYTLTDTFVHTYFTTRYVNMEVCDVQEHGATHVR